MATSQAPSSTSGADTAPLYARYTRIRALPADDFGPRDLARKVDDGQMVVIRTLTLPKGDEDRLEQISARLQTLVGIRHKKVAEFIEAGQLDDQIYLIQEDVDGRRLTDLLAERGHLSLPELVPLASQILMAVGDAHLRGIVVGGVRPQEITLNDGHGRSGLVTLRCFGLGAVLPLPTSAAFEDEPRVFCSPEHLASQPDSSLWQTPESDVFALGALFLRMLTGPLPPVTDIGTRSEILRARLEVATVDPGGLPEVFVELLHRCLDSQPDARPPDANVLMEELIDAVPMSSFRLPRVGEEPATMLNANVPASASAMTVFTGRWEAVAARKAAKESQKDAEKAPHTTNGETVSESIERMDPEVLAAVETDLGFAGTSAGAPLTDATGPTRRQVWPWVVAAAIPLLIGVGAVWAFGFSTADPPATTPEVATLPSQPTTETVAVAARATIDDSIPAAVHPELAKRAPDNDPQQPVEAMSSVEISTTPAGTLFIDDNAVGTTPYHGSVSPGRHMLRVEAKGHEVWTTHVDFKAGEGQQLKIALRTKAAETQPNRRISTPPRRPRRVASSAAPSPSASAPSATPSPPVSPNPSTSEVKPEPQASSGRLLSLDKTAPTKKSASALLPRRKD